VAEPGARGKTVVLKKKPNQIRKNGFGAEEKVSEKTKKKRRADEEDQKGKRRRRLHVLQNERGGRWSRKLTEKKEGRGFFEKGLGGRKKRNSNQRLVGDV